MVMFVNVCKGIFELGLFVFQTMEAIQNIIVLSIATGAMELASVITALSKLEITVLLAV
jgi:hypothetical protein